MARGMALRLDTADVDLARAQVARSYCPHELCPTAPVAGFHARHAEGGASELGVFALSYGSQPVRVLPVPFNDFVLVSRPLVGRFSVHGRVDEVHVGPGEAVALDPDEEHRLEFGPGCRLLTVKLPCAVLDGAAATSGRRGAIRTGPPGDSRAWDSITRFLVREVVPHGLLDTPLGKGVVQLAATALLDSFGTPEPPVRSQAGAAAAVQRACVFIEENAHTPIGLLDIAAAAGVRPRTLQEHFRSRLGTSPTEHLRRVRLNRARADLTAGTGVSVAEVAHQWGFSNHGRFAAEYRRAFGRFPARDLRR